MSVLFIASIFSNSAPVLAAAWRRAKIFG